MLRFTSKNRHPSSNKTGGLSSAMKVFPQPFSFSSKHSMQAFFQRRKLKFIGVVRYSAVSINVMGQSNTSRVIL